MNLEQARKHYREIRNTWPQGSDSRLAYDKVLICLDNARRLEEAREYLQAEIESATGLSRRAIYQDALKSIS